MTNGAAFGTSMTVVTGCTLLVMACQSIDREPFRSLDRWLTAGWNAIYRATGARNLDRRINRRRAAGDIARFEEIRAILPADSKFDESRAMLNDAIGQAARDA